MEALARKGRKNSEEKKRKKEKGAQISHGPIEEQGISSLVSPDSLDYQGVGRALNPTRRNLTTDLRLGVEAVRTLADCLKAIGHPKRFEIVQYCLEARTFTDITQNLKMNPNTFKFHSEILIANGLFEKHGRGTYRTTELGKLLLELTSQASLAVVKTV